MAATPRPSTKAWLGRLDEALTAGAEPAGDVEGADEAGLGEARWASGSPWKASATAEV